MGLLGKLGVLPLVGFVGLVLVRPILVLLTIVSSLLTVSLLMAAPLALLLLAFWLPCWLMRCWSGPAGATLRPLGSVCLETLSGAVVGGLLGAWHGPPDAAIPIGLLAGAGIGVGVAICNLKQSSPELVRTIPQ